MSNLRKPSGRVSRAARRGLAKLGRHTPAVTAGQIAQAIVRREAAGRSWTWSDFDLDEDDPMRALVREHLVRLRS